MNEVRSESGSERAVVSYFAVFPLQLAPLRELTLPKYESRAKRKDAKSRQVRIERYRVIAMR